MSVNSKVVVGHKPVNLQYPVLMRWKPTGEVVLFTSAHQGTTVVQGRGSKDVGRNVGTVSTDYISPSDAGWECLPPDVKIELSNGSLE